MRCDKANMRAERVGLKGSKPISSDIKTLNPGWAHQVRCLQQAERHGSMHLELPGCFYLTACRTLT